MLFNRYSWTWETFLCLQAFFSSIHFLAYCRNTPLFRTTPAWLAPALALITLVCLFLLLLSSLCYIRTRGPEQAAIDQTEKARYVFSEQRETTGWKYIQLQFGFHYTKMNQPSVMMDTLLPSDVYIIIILCLFLL